MVKVSVGSVEKDWSEVDQHWLCNEINGRRGDGGVDCVRVRIQEDDIDLHLSTPACARDVGGSRMPTARESEIIELWDKLHLNRAGFSCGNVNAFLVQLRRLL